MIIKNKHLCYSLNVFPGSSWIDKFKIIKDHLPNIRKQVMPDPEDAFAIGLWLDHNSVEYLSKGKHLEEFKSFLDDNNYYVFTVNAFPYGVFHGDEVKAEVYRPDWTTKLRLDYTCNVADILARLLPDGVCGSISTLPGSYKPFIKTEQQIDSITENLAKVAEYLYQLECKTGKRINLAVEMEPDCLWESPSEFVEYYNEYLVHNAHPDYIGVCYDTCHQELVDNKPGEGIQLLADSNINIAKIQLSSCIKGKAGRDLKQLGTLFNDNVYLHQTRLFNEMGCSRSFADLPDALSMNNLEGNLLIHYHVPIYSEQLTGGVGVANQEVNYVLDLVKNGLLACPQLEIETYTFNVLPEDMRKLSLEDSIIEEYKYVIDKLSEL